MVSSVVSYRIGICDQEGMQMEDAAGRSAASTQATAADADALDTLRWHWGEAYEIGRDPKGDGGPGAATAWAVT